MKTPTAQTETFLAALAGDQVLTGEAALDYACKAHLDFTPILDSHTEDDGYGNDCGPVLTYVPAHTHTDEDDIRYAQCWLVHDVTSGDACPIVYMTEADARIDYADRKASLVAAAAEMTALLAELSA